MLKSDWVCVDIDFGAVDVLCAAVVDTCAVAAIEEGDVDVLDFA